MLCQPACIVPHLFGCQFLFLGVCFPLLVLLVLWSNLSPLQDCSRSPHNTDMLSHAQPPIEVHSHTHTHGQSHMLGLVMRTLLASSHIENMLRTCFMLLLGCVSVCCCFGGCGVDARLILRPASQHSQSQWGDITMQ